MFVCVCRISSSISCLFWLTLECRLFVTVVFVVHSAAEQTTGDDVWPAQESGSTVLQRPRCARTDFLLLATDAMHLKPCPPIVRVLSLNRLYISSNGKRDLES